jgi:hypothetical protein
VIRNALILLYVVAGIACAVLLHGWRDTDTYFAVSGLALFILGLFIARRQTHLQEGLADLEVEEKITVIDGHAAALTDDDKSYVGFFALGDMLACMKVLALTTGETRSRYAEAACAALDQLGRAVRERSPFTPEELNRLTVKTRRTISAMDQFPASVQSDIKAVRSAANELMAALRTDPRHTTRELAGLPISIASFAAALQAHVRVRLDFSRLNESDFRARMCVINDPRSLVDWVSPWYVDSQGEECDHRDGDAIPTAFVDSNGRAVPAPQSHADKVKSIARSMKTDGSGPIIIGCYHPFGRDVVVVVDGNHRLRAAVMADVPLHVVAFVLYGPNDATILSDLDAV